MGLVMPQKQKGGTWRPTRLEGTITTTGQLGEDDVASVLVWDLFNLFPHFIRRLRLFLADGMAKGASDSRAKQYIT
jgi:hypothetical protein